MRRLILSTGLLGQVVAILLLTMLIEFGVSTLLYERASQFSVRDDEARRLAEHLVISRRLIEERPPAARAAMAYALTTTRYAMRWEQAPPRRARLAPPLGEMRRQILAWEPGLRTVDLRVLLTSLGGGAAAVTGGLRLADGSWLYFRTLEPLTPLTFGFERIAFALVLAIALIAIGGLMLRRILLPLRRLATAADRMGYDRVDPVPEGGPGEVRRVVGAFNRMQARIRALIDTRTEALAAVGHDLRTPLARLRLHAESVRDAPARDAIGRDVAEMEAMIASLLAFLGGENDPESPVPVDLAVLCATLVDDASDAGHVAEYAGPDHLELPLRRSAFRRALTNLVDNALQHGDRVTIALEDGAAAVTVRVIDDGPGIPAEQLDAVIQPFVRLDPARPRDTVGFGLGLAIAAQAVAAEGGTLTLANREPHGLEATVRLPRPGGNVGAA